MKTKNEIAEEIVNHFMNKGATVSKEDYDFVLSMFPLLRQDDLQSIREMVGEANLVDDGEGGSDKMWIVLATNQERQRILSHLSIENI